MLSFDSLSIKNLSKREKKKVRQKKIFNGSYQVQYGSMELLLSLIRLP
jgi:hypothetical protein